MPDQFRMPVTPDAAESAIAEAEEVVRLAAAREQARARRTARKAEAARCRQQERDRNAAGQRERQRAAEERLRAEAGRARVACYLAAAQAAEPPAYRWPGRSRNRT